MSPYNFTLISIRVLSIYIMAAFGPSAFGSLTLLGRARILEVVAMASLSLIYPAVALALWLLAPRLARVCSADIEEPSGQSGRLHAGSVLRLAVIIIGVLSIGEVVPSLTSATVLWMRQYTDFWKTSGRSLVTGGTGLTIGILMIVKAREIEHWLSKYAETGNEE